MDREILRADSSRDSLIAHLILLNLPGIGCARFWQLREHFGHPALILNTPSENLEKFLPDESYQALKKFWADSNRHIGNAEQILEQLEVLSVDLICSEDERYPALLKNTHQAPPLLYAQGNLANLSLPQIAIIGSRNPSPTGRENAFRFARELASTGFAITSGLAIGVDGAAHQGALADVNGKTIAVLGSGIDKIYPRRHQALAAQILDSGGTLLSEFPMATDPHASHFPRRNRIISGLSLGVVVIEAAIKSGSLITARYALQQGREVFAIPGSIHNPLTRGCHALIKDGATLVEKVQDIEEPLQGLIEFKWDELKQNQETSSPEWIDLNRDERTVFNNIDYCSATVEVLLNRTKLGAGKLLSLLIALELRGLIVQSDDGYQRVVTSSEK